MFVPMHFLAVLFFVVTAALAKVAAAQGNSLMSNGDFERATDSAKPMDWGEGFFHVVASDSPSTLKTSGG